MARIVGLITKPVLRNNVVNTSKLQVETEQELAEVANPEVRNLNVLTVPQIKVLLDEKSIEYNDRAKKEDLIKLLEGAE